MKKIPDSCRDCPENSSCNNPAPYGMYRCRYAKEIQQRAVEAALNKKEEYTNGNG